MPSITKNVSRSWLSQVIYILAQLARVPLLYKIFQPEARGTWFLMVSMVGFAALLELGLAGAFARFYARGKGKDIVSVPFEDLAANAKIVFFFLGLTAFVLSFGVGITYLHFIRTFRLFSGGVTLSWLLLCLSQGMIMSSYQYSSVLQGRGYVGLDSIIKSGSMVVSLAVLLPALFFRASLAYVAFTEMARAVFMIAVFRHYCRRLAPEYFSVRPSFQSTIFTVLLRSSVIPTVAMLGGSLIVNTDPMFIASWLNVAKVSDYYNAHQFVAQIYGFCTLISTSAWPTIVSIFGSGDYTAVRALYYKILKYCILGYSIFGVYALFSGKYILELWLGKGHFVGFPVFALLLVFYFLETQNMVFLVAQYGVERYPMLLTYWIGAALRYIVTLFLVRRYNLVGVISGKILAQTLTTYWFTIYYCLKTLKIWPVNLSVLKKGLQAYAPIPLFLAIGYATRMSFASDLQSFIFQTLAYFSLVFCAGYFLVHKEVRDQVAVDVKRIFSI